MQNIRRIAGNQKGVTIFETSIAIVITLIITLSLLRAHLNVQHSVQQSSHHYEIIHILQSYIETEKSKDYDAVTSQSLSNITLSDNGTDDASDDLTGTVNIAVSATGNDSKQVTATAIWNEKASNAMVTRSESIATRIANVN